MLKQKKRSDCQENWKRKKMMKKWEIFALGLSMFAVLIITSCATYQPPKTYDFEKERVISKPFDETWGEIIEWFASYGSPIKNMDKNSGFIATEFNLSVSNSEDYFDCGQAGANISTFQKFENPIGNFNILVKKIDDARTKIVVNTFFSVTVNYYQHINMKFEKSEKINCNSTGVLEKELLDYISK